MGHSVENEKTEDPRRLKVRLMSHSTICHTTICSCMVSIEGTTKAASGGVLGKYLIKNNLALYCQRR